MADIRKKFIDILFEPEDDDEEEIQVKKAEEAPVKPPVVREEKKELPLQAREVMYKTEKKTSFANIQLDEKEKEKAPETQDPYEFEALPNISPIFGVIDNKNKKKETEVKVDTTQTIKPESSYLGTIISPFYGYDEEKANEERMNLIRKINKEKEDDLMDVTGDLDDLFEDDYKERRLEKILEEDTTYVVGNEIDLFADVFGEEKK